MNAGWLIACSSSAGPSRLSDGFEERTTVTAPMIATVIPSRSSWSRALRQVLKEEDTECPANLTELLFEHEGGEEAVGNESKLN